MSIDPKKLKKRFETAHRHKEQWRTIYEEAYRFMLPHRNQYDGYGDSDVPGQDKTDPVFDSTAQMSLQRLANRIQSGLFPPQRNWCRLIAGNQIPRDAKPILQESLDVYTDVLFDTMKQSQFDLAMGEFLLDLCIGTAVMMIQKGDDDTQPIKFTPISPFQIAFEEGPHGTVENVYRKQRRPFENISREWPDAEIPKSMKDSYRERPTELVDLCESIYYDSSKKLFCYYVTDKTFENVLVYDELKNSPYIISRWLKVAGERYGRGPALSVLGDTKTLNKVTELTLKGASLSIGGVFTARDDGVLNPSTISIVPGAIIPVASNASGGAGPSLSPLPRSGDAQMSQIVSADMRMAIKKGLYDESLPPDTMSARSATEVAERMKELSQNLGSAFGRLISETMIPIVRQSLNIMDEQGLIQMPLKVNGLQVQVRPQSPLAMAQNMEKLNELQTFVAMAQGLGPQGAQMLPMIMNMERAADYAAYLIGIPQSIRTSPSERAEMVQQAQAVMQNMQQAQQNVVVPSDEQVNAAMDGTMQ